MALATKKCTSWVPACVEQESIRLWQPQAAFPISVDGLLLLGHAAGCEHAIWLGPYAPQFEAARKRILAATQLTATLMDILNDQAVSVSKHRAVWSILTHVVNNAMVFDCRCVPPQILWPMCLDLDNRITAVAACICVVQKSKRYSGNNLACPLSLVDLRSRLSVKERGRHSSRPFRSGQQSSCKA